MSLLSFNIEENLYDKPYIIAEIGVNHENSFDTAIKIIDLAKEGGADAVKFQSYKADTLASKDSPAYWDITKEPTLNQNKLFKKYDSFEAKDYLNLFLYCKKIGIDFLSTPFDLESVEYLSDIVPFFKIASADITNFELLSAVAKKNKPILLSTGASNIDEISQAIQLLKKNNCTEIGLMHCILNYPTQNINANLSMITSIKNHFPEYIVGYSDHTLPDDNMTSIVTASILGAKVIEKHFTHDKNLPGNDHYHAMDVNDLLNLNKNLAVTLELLGTYDDKSPIPSEELSRLNARRSIVAKRKIKIGSILSGDDLICKRPASGITANYWNNIIGKKILFDIDEDTILQWDHIE